MNKIALAAAGASLVLVTIIATRAAVDDSGGAQSAGPVPGSLAGTATGASLPAADLPAVDYTIDLDTGVMTPLPEAIIKSLGPTYVGTSTYDPAMSRYGFAPEVSMLAFIGESPGDQSPQLFVAAIDGTGVRQLTFGDAVDGICCAATPAWSPDGTKIVFDSPQGIYVVDVASGSLTLAVAPFPNEEYRGYANPTFSPDGERIIYGGRQGVRAVPVSIGPSTLLFGSGTGGMTHASNASVSPDGTQVTMMGGITGSCCYRVLGDIDGTDLKPLGNVHSNESSLGSSNASGTWSPDGDRIVTGTEIDGIAVTDVSTGQVEIVARGNGAIWLDDHTLLVEVS